MSDRTRRFERRRHQRDEQRRQQTRIAPTEWAQLTRQQKQLRIRQAVTR